MAYNIKNEDTVRLAREVASLEGVSVNDGIANALRRRREELLAERAHRRERILRRARDCARRLSDEVRTLDHGEFLYDHNGMPA